MYIGVLFASHSHWSLSSSHFTIKYFISLKTEFFHTLLFFSIFVDFTGFFAFCTFFKNIHYSMNIHYCSGRIMYVFLTKYLAFVHYVFCITFGNFPGLSCRLLTMA